MDNKAPAHLEVLECPTAAERFIYFSARRNSATARASWSRTMSTVGMQLTDEANSLTDLGWRVVPEADTAS